MFQETSALRDYGLGAALMFVLMILREIIAKLLERAFKKNGTSGERSVSEWKLIITEIVSEEMGRRAEMMKMVAAENSRKLDEVLSELRRK